MHSATMNIVDRSLNVLASLAIFTLPINEVINPLAICVHKGFIFDLKSTKEKSLIKLVGHILLILDLIKIWILYKICCK